MKLFRTLVLTLALSGSVYAGNIQNGIVPPPQPASTEQPAPLISEEPKTEQTPTATEILLTVVRVLGLI
jgi:hypothetical protein